MEEFSIEIICLILQIVFEEVAGDIWIYSHSAGCRQHRESNCRICRLHYLACNFKFRQDFCVVKSLKILKRKQAKDKCLEETVKFWFAVLYSVYYFGSQKRAHFALFFKNFVITWLFPQNGELIPQCMGCITSISAHPFDSGLQFSNALSPGCEKLFPGQLARLIS